jgi:hypothetical protein
MGLMLAIENNSPVQVRMRRFADLYNAPPLAVMGGGPKYILKLGQDDLGMPWRVQIVASGLVTVCGLGT